MHALVVFESMYGNTHAIGDQIAEGLRPRFDVTVVPVGDASDALVSGADLVVVGGPTHAHGLSSRSTRRMAADAAKKDASLALEPARDDQGLREWLRVTRVTRVTAEGHPSAAAFDTRFRKPAAFTGRASRGIARRLRRHGFHLVLPPESFFVDTHNRLLDGEKERARAWGAALAGSVDAGSVDAGSVDAAHPTSAR